MDCYDVDCIDNPPISLYHSHLEKFIRTVHTIKNPYIYVIDKISNYYITNHKKMLFISYQM